MHFNNQTEEKNENRVPETEDTVVSPIEKEDQKENDQKEEVKTEEETDLIDQPIEEAEEQNQDEQDKPEEPEISPEKQQSPDAEEEQTEETVKDEIEPDAEEESQPLTDESSTTESAEKKDEELDLQPDDDDKSEETTEENEPSPTPEDEPAPLSEEQETTLQEEEKPEEPEEPESSSEKPQPPVKEPETPEEAALAKEMAQYEETFRDYKPGEIIEGTIVGFNDKEVLVDISYKSEGSIPISDFGSSEEIQLNTKIKVYINKVENSEGKVSLSKKVADFHLALDDLKQVYKNNETVSGTIKQRVKGGMIAEIKGLNAFLPGSQISIKPIPNLDQFIGKEVKFRIINIDEHKKNIIVSRKKVLEEEREEKVSKLLEKIQIGAELDGEVKNITDYGAFIDLGGMDGLLHITDMSWGHINHPSEMLNIGDKLKVKVIGYEEEDSRVSLGLKQLVPHPWENVGLKYEEGSKVTGKVVNITHYGAFVELEPGVEGLVHVSEMSWTKKIANPKHILNIGDTVNAIVLSVSKEEQKISLGMKQMEPNPWLIIDERYPVGTLIKGKVKSLTTFGAFIEIEEDIDGLIHISDISWTKRIYHPKEVLKKGQEVETVVLSVDKHLHRIALGMKQLLPDPWEELDQKLPINSEVTGVITKIIPKGVLIDIDVDGTPIEGFVPISHLAIPRLDKPEAAFNTGDEIPMKVIELDMENRRLILSIKAYFFSKEREALQEFLKIHEPEIRLQAKRAEKKEKAEKAAKLEAEKAAAEMEEAKPEAEEEPETDETTAVEETASETEQPEAEEPEKEAEESETPQTIEAAETEETEDPAEEEKAPEEEETEQIVASEEDIPPAEEELPTAEEPPAEEPKPEAEPSAEEEEEDNKSEETPETEEEPVEKEPEVQPDIEEESSAEEKKPDGNDEQEEPVETVEEEEDKEKTTSEG